MATLLRVDGLTKRFGGVVAVDDVSFSACGGEIVGIIGPNGAGKTTMFDLIGGFLQPDRGAICLDGVDLAGQRPDQVCRHGVCRSHQLTRPFRRLSVFDNILIGALCRSPSMAHARRVAQQRLLECGLVDRASVSATNLTAPEQRQLELARVLATQPRILLLDEIFAGLGEESRRRIAELLVRTRGDGVGIILIEHVLEVVWATVDRVVVLSHGTKLAEGPPSEVIGRSDVEDAYLGGRLAVRS